MNILKQMLFESGKEGKKNIDLIESCSPRKKGPLKNTWPRYPSGKTLGP
jgi:hypothetical protein